MRDTGIVCHGAAERGIKRLIRRPGRETQRLDLIFALLLQSDAPNLLDIFIPRVQPTKEALSVTYVSISPQNNAAATQRRRGNENLKA